MDTDTGLAQRLFERLRDATGDGVGISRESYGAGESLALDIVEGAAHTKGLATERDAGANLIVTLLGRDPTLPFLACGSHLDSVPQGGNYAAAGVVAGLLALARFRAEGFQPTRTVRLYVWRPSPRLCCTRIRRRYAVFDVSKKVKRLEEPSHLLQRTGESGRPVLGLRRADQA
jgi:hypothetical protein